MNALIRKLYDLHDMTAREIAIYLHLPLDQVKEVLR